MNTASTNILSPNPLEMLWELFQKQPTEIKKAFKDRLLHNEIVCNDNRNKFYSLLNQWRNNTAALSSPKQITSDEAFLQIVSMGKDAVPYILDEISDKPSNLVWALNIMFKKKISNSNITIQQACELWTKELR